MKPSGFCEWIVENADNCPLFPKDLFIGLREVVANWNSEELMQPLRSTVETRQKVEEALRGVTVHDAFVKLPNAFGIAMAYKALMRAADHRTFVLAECRNVKTGLAERGPISVRP